MQIPTEAPLQPEDFEWADRMIEERTQPMATVFMKDGKDKRMPLDEACDFIFANPELIQARKLPRKPRRRAF